MPTIQAAIPESIGNPPSDPPTIDDVVRAVSAFNGSVVAWELNQDYLPHAQTAAIYHQEIVSRHCAVEDKVKEVLKEQNDREDVTVSQCLDDIFRKIEEMQTRMDKIQDDVKKLQEATNIQEDAREHQDMVKVKLKLVS